MEVAADIDLNSEFSVAVGRTVLLWVNGGRFYNYLMIEGENRTLEFRGWFSALGTGGMMGLDIRVPGTVKRKAFSLSFICGEFGTTLRNFFSVSYSWQKMWLST